MGVVLIFDLYLDCSSSEIRAPTDKKEAYLEIYYLLMEINYVE
jgi:hypothetical protein